MNQAEAREEHRDHFREAMNKHGKQMDNLNKQTEHMEQHLHIARQLARFDRDIRVIGRTFGFCLMFVWIFALAIFAKMFL